MAQTKTELVLKPLPIQNLPDEAQEAQEEDDYYQPTAEEIAQDWELLRQYEAEYGPIEIHPARPIDPDKIVMIHSIPVPAIARKAKESSS